MPIPTNKQHAPRQRKVGEGIVHGTDYPRSFDEFVGQEPAKQQLQATIASAIKRDQRMDHILLASGAHGIGKTTLAQIVAYQRGTGYVTTSGPLTVDDARRLLMQMDDSDVLFWDEFHLAVAGNRNRADWMLPLLTDRVLLTKHGSQQMPDVTVIAATTEVGKLPQTIISRFMVRPALSYYTDDEGAILAFRLAARMKVRVNGDANVWTKIARAANNNPRAMRMILTAIRDQAATGPVSLALAFEWAGVTADGLTRECQDILLTLVSSEAFTASLETLQASLGEPGSLKHAEQMLIQKGLMTVTGRGRRLTDTGVERAVLLAKEQERV